MMFEPEIETLPSAEQRRRDDTLYRKQVAYLFANSRFYREKLGAAGYATP
jgi:phenylacetate-CoA ligase